MRQPNVITEDHDFPIKPQDIDATKYMWDAFGNRETDNSAGHIVRLMQRKGDWLPFTYAEIKAFYRETIDDGIDFSFNHLLRPFTVRKGGETFTERLDVIVCSRIEVHEGARILDEDVFRVTDEFVFACYRSTGITRVKQPQTTGQGSEPPIELQGDQQ